MNDTRISFPSTKAEALALEYAKLKADSNTTAEQFVNLYQNAYKQIHEALNQSSKWSY